MTPKLNQDKWMKYERDIIKYYYPMLRDWLEDGMKKPAIIQFTSGLGRDIGILMEEAIQAHEKEILEMIKLECKPYDMTYGEVGNKKLSYEEIEKIIRGGK